MQTISYRLENGLTETVESKRELPASLIKGVFNVTKTPTMNGLGNREELFQDEETFRYLLDKWNRQQPKNYRYEFVSVEPFDALTKAYKKARRH